MAKYDKSEENRLKIRNWLLAQEYTMQPAQIPGKSWAMVAESYHKDFGCLIAVEAKSPHIIGLGLTLPLEIYQNLLDALPSKERKEFLYDLRFKLLELDISFSVPFESFAELVYATHLLEEELSKIRLLQAIHQLNKAILITVWSFERKFDIGDSNKLSSFPSYSTTVH